MKQLVIVGGGFAGVRVARQLRKQKNIKITLVNESEDFRYCPALYRAATGFKLGTARLPLEWMLLDNPNADLILGKAEKINPKQKFVALEDGTKLHYDYAVLAMGSVTTYFNIEGLHEHSYGIKTAEEVVKLREHLHDKVAQKSHLEENYVIVGAGPTGVELAGALGAYLQRIARRHKAKKHNINIWLIEAAPRILPQMSDKAASVAQKRLERLGVKIALDTQVKGETLQTLKTSAGSIKTHTVIWTAGSANNPFFIKNTKQFRLNNRNKVLVDEYLRSHPDVYVIGDNAATKYSGTALTAIRHGNFTAKDIAARLNHRARPHKYESSPVSVVPAGKAWAVMQYRGLIIHGRVASWIRKVADYVGYSDVLGYFRALTIWSNSETMEDACRICQKRS